MTPFILNSCQLIEKAIKKKREHTFHIHRTHDQKNIPFDQVALISDMFSFEKVEKITNMNEDIVYRAQTPCNCRCPHDKYHTFPDFIEVLPGEYFVHLSTEYYTCGGEAYLPMGNKKCVTRWGGREVPGKRNVFMKAKRLKAEGGTIYNFDAKKKDYVPIDFTVRESSPDQSFKKPQKFLDDRKKCTPAEINCRGK